MCFRLVWSGLQHIVERKNKNRKYLDICSVDKTRGCWVGVVTTSQYTSRL